MLKIQSTLLDIESLPILGCFDKQPDIKKNLDKNSNPYYKLSLTNLPARYFYAFSDLPQQALTLLEEAPHKLVDQLVLITYEELPKTGLFQKYKVREIKLWGSN